MSLSDIRSHVLAALMAALTAVGAYIAIPLGPAPIVLATVFVLLSGTLLGSRLGLISMGVYLVVGLVGMPVFSLGRGGIAHFAGPLGGFLLGYLLAAWVAGLIVTRGRRRPAADILAVGAGTACIFLVGVPWLRWHPALHYGWEQALTAGLLPFLPGALVKGVLVVHLTRHLRPVLERLPAAPALPPVPERPPAAPAS